MKEWQIKLMIKGLFATLVDHVDYAIVYDYDPNTIITGHGVNTNTAFQLVVDADEDDGVYLNVLDIDNDYAIIYQGVFTDVRKFLN